MQSHKYLDLEQFILGIDEGPEQLYETLKPVKLGIFKQILRHGMI